jgi:hypothetical protein
MQMNISYKLDKHAKVATRHIVKATAARCFCRASLIAYATPLSAPFGSVCACAFLTRQTRARNLPIRRDHMPVRARGNGARYFDILLSQPITLPFNFALIERPQKPTYVFRVRMPV